MYFCRVIHTWYTDITCIMTNHNTVNFMSQHSFQTFLSDIFPFIPVSFLSDELYIWPQVSWLNTASWVVMEFNLRRSGLIQYRRTTTGSTLDGLHIWTSVHFPGPLSAQGHPEYYSIIAEFCFYSKVKWTFHQELKNRAGQYMYIIRLWMHPKGNHCVTSLFPFF